MAIYKNGKNGILLKNDRKVAEVYKGNQKLFGYTKAESGAVVTASDVHPVEHELKLKVKSKNLIQYPYMHTTTTINGIDFTDNGDGTITANGTATANAVFNIASKPTTLWNGLIPNEAYTASLEYEGNYSGTVSLIVNYFPIGSASYSSWLLASTRKNTTKVSPSDMVGVRSYILIGNGATVENLVLRPQLESGSTATDYTPYISDFKYVSVNRFGADSEIKTAKADSQGNVTGLTSTSPTMTLYPDADGVIIDCKYISQNS